MENNKAPLLVSISAVIGILIGIFVGMKYQQSGHGHHDIALGGAPTGSCTAEGSSAHKPVIKIDGKEVYSEQLPLEIQMQIYETAHQGFERNSSILDSFALQYFKAKEKGSADLNNLPSLQDLYTSKEPTEKELKEFFKQNKNRMPPNTKFEEIKPRLVQFLQSQQGRAAMMADLEKLKKQGNYTVLLSEPNSPKVELDYSGFPSKGPKTAKNIVVEASDYTCGHCKSVHPQVKKFIKEMSNDTRFIQINFALRPDGTSGKMVRGGFCAQKEDEQKFWAYHDMAFEHSGDKEMDPLEVAQKTGLDMKTFKTCLDSNEAKTFVKKTNEMLNKAGVTGTPTFFVNNKKVHAHGDIMEALKASLL